MAQAHPGKFDDWMRQGLALHQSGRLGEAEVFYRRVLDRQPSYPAANHLLGLIRLQQGDADAAVGLISRAVHVRGNDPQYHCNLGVALNAAGQPGRAVASFERAIALQPGYADAHSNRGMALKQLGRPAEAVESYRQAIAIRPGEAGFHLNLANALTDLGDLHAAEAAYRRALDLRPGYPAALSGLCLTLEALDRTEEAVAAGEQAVALGPGEPEYHRSLGRALRAAGRPVEAVASYRRAIALNPLDAEAYRLMSLILRRGGKDDDLQAMERLLADGALPAEQQAHLHFALGKGYLELGDGERSFDHYRRGNALRREAAPFSLVGVEREFATIRRLFGDTAGVAPRASAAAETPPVFIVGLPRSGKSSLEGTLGRHDQARKGGELPLLGVEVARLWRGFELSRPDSSLRDVPAEAIAALGERYMAEARKLAPPPLRLIDTMPLNFRHIGFIRLALPEARIIHCTRDPLEHCVAMFQKYFARPGFEFASDLGDLAAYYGLYRQLMAHWRFVFPGAILDVDVQELRREPEARMRTILDFCGLEWDPACLAPYEPEPEIGAAGQLAPQAERLRPYEAALGSLRGPAS